MIYLILKIIFYLLTWQLIIFTVTGLDFHPIYNQSAINDELVNQVKYRNKRDVFFPITITIDDDGKLMEIILQPTNQRLANKFVPVWHARGTGLIQGVKIKYTKRPSDMSRLGDFIMYQNLKFHAAVVYFKKIQMLCGVIGNRYYFENLPVKELNTTQIVGGRYIKKRNLKACKYPTLGGVHNLSGKKTWPKNVDQSELPTNLPTSSALYPELLILIDHDVLKNTEDDYIHSPTGFLNTLAYIVTYFNAVDMIYSKLINPTVELNIAGIVIEVEPQTFDFIYKNRRAPGDPAYRVDVILDDMPKHFESSQSDVFRCGTFDTAILFIGNDIYHEDFKVWGLANTIDNAYDWQMNGYCAAHYLLAVIRYQADYESYPVTAHEIGHSFTINHDEETQDDPLVCDKNIMHELETCPDCLEWSQQSIEAFKKYFSSKQHCILINYPRSLSSNYARRLVTRNQLCHCYGLPYAIGGSQDTDFDCNNYSYCADDYIITKHPVPIDGTSCGKDKVCWDRECRKATPYIPELDKMKDELICN